MGHLLLPCSEPRCIRRHQVQAMQSTSLTDFTERRLVLSAADSSGPQASRSPTDARRCRHSKGIHSARPKSSRRSAHFAGFNLFAFLAAGRCRISRLQVDAQETSLGVCTDSQGQSSLLAAPRSKRPARSASLASYCSWVLWILSPKFRLQAVCGQTRSKCPNGRERVQKVYPQRPRTSKLLHRPFVL